MPDTIKAGPEETYYLSTLIKKRVFFRDKKIGKLADLIITDHGKLAEVTHLYIKRPFGDPSLIVPWDKVESITPFGIMLSIEGLQNYEAEPKAADILLKDHIMDKKVLDLEDREVDVVFDVKMLIINKKMFVTDVDFSRYAMLRRMRFKWFADFIYNLAFSINARSLYHNRLKILSTAINNLANKMKDRPVPWTYIQPLPSNLGSFQGDVKLTVIKNKVFEILPVDLADILEELDHEQRVTIFRQLDSARASDTLEEIDPGVQRALVSSLGTEKTAELINKMTPAQAADVLSVLAHSQADKILVLIEKNKKDKIESIMKQQEEQILNFATTNLLKFSPDKTVGWAEEEYHNVAKGKDVVMYIYVAAENDTLLGVIDIKEILQASNEMLLQDIMTTSLVVLKPNSTLKQASAMFIRYGFRAIPITDKAGKLLGAVPYRDIMNLKHKFLA